jgi:23S rRNA (adenine2503-C2)-methyltransferase
MKEIRCKSFLNGKVYALQTNDDFSIETTDTFLPFYTKDAIGRKQNSLSDGMTGDRTERWMIGVSCMSGCPVRCKFCATGRLKKYRNLTCQEIINQIYFIQSKNDDYDFFEAEEHKINYTRMGEPFLNIDHVRNAIGIIEHNFPGTHHYISTIGIKGSDFSWIEENVTLQISLHSLSEKNRNWLIPYKNKMTIKELGKIRTNSNLKTTVNLSLVDISDFDIELLKEFFDPEYFFIKLSPINPNECSESYRMGTGAVQGINLL